MTQPFLAQRRRPLLAQEEPLPLLQQVQDYHQNQSGAQQLYQQNMAEQARHQAEYQRRLAADEVGIEPYSLFLGRQTEDPSAGFELAPADVFPGGAAVKKGLLATAAAIPSLMYWNYARKNPVPSGMLGGPVFHGTPHKWESGVPDLSKVGTGEGAQAYGHGIYFAENPDVAKSYSPRDFDAEDEMMRRYKIAELSEDYFGMEVWERAMMHDTPKEIRSNFTIENGYNRGQVERAEKIAGDLENIPQKSAFYELDIPDSDIEKMFDWDSALDEQPDFVKQAFKNAAETLKDPQLKQLANQAYAGMIKATDTFENWTGSTVHQKLYRIFDRRAFDEIESINRELSMLAKVMQEDQVHGMYRKYKSDAGRTAADRYDELMDLRSDLGDPRGQVNQKVSELLNQLGLPGIRYLDQGSRGVGSGTRNFVVFDEKLLNKMSTK